MLGFGSKDLLIPIIMAIIRLILKFKSPRKIIKIKLCSID